MRRNFALMYFFLYLGIILQFFGRIFGLLWLDVSGAIGTIVGIISGTIATIKWFRGRKSPLKIQYIDLRQPNQSSIIIIRVEWVRGPSVSLDVLALVCYQKAGLSQYLFDPEEVTIGSAHRVQLLDAGPKEKDDVILGVAVCDNKSRWHYSDGFPKNQRYSKKNLRRGRESNTPPNYTSKSYASRIVPCEDSTRICAS